MTPSIELAPHCAGRFCLGVPAGMRITVEFEMQETRLSEVWSPKGEAISWEAEWERKLKKIESLREARTFSKDASGSIVDQVELIPGKLKSIIYNFGSSDGSIAVDSLLQTEHSGLWLSVEGDIEFRNAMVDDTLKLARAYRPRLGDEHWPTTGKDRFYLQHGVIELPPQRSEFVGVALRSAGDELVFDMEMKTVVDPDRSGLFERMARAVVNAGANYMAGLSSVKQRKRRISDLKGEEMILRDSKAKSLNYVWIYSGEPKSAVRPRINIQMETADSKLEEKTAVWDSILNSIRPAAAG